MSLRVNLIVTEHADLALHAYLAGLPVRERGRAVKQLACMSLAFVMQGHLGTVPAIGNLAAAAGAAPAPEAAPRRPAARKPERAREVAAPVVSAPVQQVVQVPAQAPVPDPVQAAPAVRALEPLQTQQAAAPAPVAAATPAEGAYSLAGLELDDVGLDFG